MAATIGEVGEQIRAAMALLPIAEVSGADGLLDEAGSLIAHAAGGGSAELGDVDVQYQVARGDLAEILARFAHVTKLVHVYLDRLGLPMGRAADPSDAPETNAAPRRSGGWAAVSDLRTADCPGEDEIRVTESRRIHILDGDGNGRSGGHLHGTGRPGKSEFPAYWGEDKVIAAILDVARAPEGPPRWQDFGTWLVRGTRDGVRIAVVVRPNGEIITGYPEEGEGVTRNPRKRGQRQHGL